MTKTKEWFIFNSCIAYITWRNYCWRDLRYLFLLPEVYYPNPKQGQGFIFCLILTGSLRESKTKKPLLVGGNGLCVWFVFRRVPSLRTPFTDLRSDILCAFPQTILKGNYNWPLRYLKKKKKRRKKRCSHCKCFTPWSHPVTRPAEYLEWAHGRIWRNAHSPPCVWRCAGFHLYMHEYRHTHTHRNTGKAIFTQTERRTWVTAPKLAPRCTLNLPPPFFFLLSSWVGVGGGVTLASPVSF